jgi:hypothetical protein
MAIVRQVLVLKNLRLEIWKKRKKKGEWLVFLLIVRSGNY